MTTVVLNSLVILVIIPNLYTEVYVNVDREIQHIWDTARNV